MSILPDLSRTPAAIQASTRAVVWNYEVRDGAPTKVPYQPHRPGEKAAVDDPTTWNTFAVAYDTVEAGKADGVGIVLGSGLVGIDVDHCRNATTGDIAAHARAVVQTLNSYTERSPSDEGLHVLLYGELPPGRRRTKAIEIYSDRRYFTITGRHLEGTPTEIQDRREQLRAWYAREFASVGSPPPPKHPIDSTTLDDAAVLVKASSASNGARFVALWQGDVSQYDGDESAGDLALANLLAFWCARHADQIDRLFRQSGLFRAKWDAKRGETTYGAMTIARAIADCVDIYIPAIDIQIEEDDPADTARDADVDADVDQPAQRAAAPSASTTWPTLAPEALTGLFGDLVQIIAPHSEADPVALLSQALVAWGNLIGRSPGVFVGADDHRLNNNVLLAGDTSIGRKGMSWSHVFAVMADVDRDWATTRVLAGLSSGEGLIYHVRDAREEQEPIRERGKVTGYQTVILDEGVTDKRLLALETEFAKTLRVSRRDGNTLSAVLRQAWDTGALRVLTKSSPIAATGAHISIVAHISPRELRQELKTTDMASGFINRFLLLLVRRSQCLPEGGTVDPRALAELVQRFTGATAVARRATTITRDTAAREHWRAVYPQLTRERSGLVGAISNRAPAHVLRLACLYALADRSTVIQVAHQEAAVALWTYAETSATTIFGVRVGHRLGDYLLALLRATPAGLTRTQIRDALGRHRHADEISEALQLLEDYGLAWKVRSMDGVGRPTTRWQAGKPAT